VGRIAEAERIFSELAAANPGNAEALVDLALTQQRGEAWEKALITWQKVYAISPASRKKEAIGPLLRAYERLNRHREAAALLFQHIDSLGDEKEQFAAFQDLLNLCAKHNLVEWLREEMEKRRKLRTDDYFTEIALGRVLKLIGQQSRRFEVLADAAFAAPNQAEALPELVREAEELRKLDAAIRLQEQLVRILPQREPEPLIKLARLQEKNFDLSAAAKTWEKVAARFPRDAGRSNRRSSSSFARARRRAPRSCCGEFANSIPATCGRSRNSHSSTSRRARPKKPGSVLNRFWRTPKLALRTSHCACPA
jgi:tetratricopeptide (TPR) repeat protein